MNTGTRRTLAHKAMLRSIDVRTRAGLDFTNPLDIYALCDRLGVTVRFVDFSMEGVYARKKPPQILLSALRPLPRRVFNCAHELGHHEFGHGFTVDELIDEHRAGATNTSEEFVVQTFAGFLLMPTLGVRAAFARRGWSAETVTPAQVFTVACSFGIGYATLINHLAYSLNMVSYARAAELLKVTPGRIRRDLLGTITSPPLIVVDRHWLLPTLDAEVGTQVLLPAGAQTDDDRLVWQADLPSGALFRATKPGITCVSNARADSAIFVRISRREYVGLSRYRHLDPAEGDDEEDQCDD